MLRVIEVLGLLAPIAAGVLLLCYRRRSLPAFGWGIVGCLLAAVATGIGAFGGRASITAALRSGGGLEGILEQMGTMAWVRFLLLLAGVAFLMVAALVDRQRERPPVGWILSGLVFAALGGVVRGMDISIEGHEGLTVVVELLMEAVEAGLLGLAVLLLAVAAVARRRALDAHPEPTELARRAGMTAWRLYNDYRGSRYR